MADIQKGIYALIIYLRKGAEIKVGKLGAREFKRGYYIYTGSAQNNLEKRVARHLSSDKKLRWHIDYLLEHAKVIKVLKFYTSKAGECMLAQKIGELPDSEVALNRFGSSDCNCKTHLHFFNKRPATEQLRKLTV